MMELVDIETSKSEWKCFDVTFQKKRFGVVYALETITLHRKWSFLLSISSVNVTKSAEHIYWRTP